MHRRLHRQRPRWQIEHLAALIIEHGLLAQTSPVALGTNFQPVNLNVIGIFDPLQGLTGMTGLTPEQRLGNHLRGIKAARVVTKFGVRLVPTLYGQPLFTKPPGIYVAIALCSAPFGAVTEWTARLPSALAARTAGQSCAPGPRCEQRAIPAGASRHPAAPRSWWSAPLPGFRAKTARPPNEPT